MLDIENIFIEMFLKIHIILKLLIIINEFSSLIFQN